MKSILINKANVVFFDTSLPSMRTVYSHATWHVLQHLGVSMVINYNNPTKHESDAVGMQMNS